MLAHAGLYFSGETTDENQNISPFQRSLNKQATLKQDLCSEVLRFAHFYYKEVCYVRKGSPSKETSCFSSFCVEFVWSLRFLLALYAACFV